MSAAERRRHSRRTSAASHRPAHTRGMHGPADARCVDHGPLELMELVLTPHALKRLRVGRRLGRRLKMILRWRLGLSLGQCVRLRLGLSLREPPSMPLT